MNNQKYLYLSYFPSHSSWSNETSLEPINVETGFNQTLKISVGFFNLCCYQTSGPFSSFSWRSSTMNDCSPTSLLCRRTGVLHVSALLHSSNTYSLVLSCHMSVYKLIWCVCRKPMEREEEHWGQFPCWDRPHQSETHRDPEPNL